MNRALPSTLRKTRPALKVSCSSALSAEIREYERTSTTVLNALLIPVIAGYLEKLTHRMQAEGFAPRLLLVQSNGGYVPPGPRRWSRYAFCFRDRQAGVRPARC